MNTLDRLILLWTGSLYLRRVISEQNLKNEQFSLKEKWVSPLIDYELLLKWCGTSLIYCSHCIFLYPLVFSRVFVLADPAVFSVQLGATVRKHLEVSSFLRNTSTLERNVVQHVLQTGLGVTCQSSKVAQALEVNEFEDVLDSV